MAARVAPAKNTGGGGFAFEDDVCAWFMACMLASERVFDVSLGPIVRLDFQTGVDGWYLDDVLLSTSAGSESYRFALSLKSNAQFTATSAPPDFIDAVWRQWLRIASSVFDPAYDRLGLVTGPLSNAARDSINGLLEKVAVADPQTFPKRLSTPKWASKSERSLFASFACPTSVESANPPDQTETARLLKHVRASEFDFGTRTSVSLKRALRLCRDLVRSHSDEDAEVLWQQLRACASEHRPKAGTLSRNDLVHRLCEKISLVGHPDHRADWRALDDRSSSDASAIADSLGGHVRLEQVDELNGLKGLLKAGLLITIGGASGVGKSVLARKLYESRCTEGNRTLWVDASSLDVAGFAAFESNLQLENPLSELLHSASEHAPVLIIDGLERLYDEC